MLHHVEIYVSDLERTVAFWTPLMEQLGFTPDPWPGGINYMGGRGKPYVCLVQASEPYVEAGFHRKRVGLNHIAVSADSRQHVDEVREWARTAGHTLLYDDQYPFATGPDYYAAFIEDPDRIKIEIIAPD